VVWLYSNWLWSSSRYFGHEIIDEFKLLEDIEDLQVFLLIFGPLVHCLITTSLFNYGSFDCQNSL